MSNPKTLGTRLEESLTKSSHRRAMDWLKAHTPQSAKVGEACPEAASLLADDKETSPEVKAERQKALKTELGQYDYLVEEGSTKITPAKNAASKGLKLVYQDVPGKTRIWKVNGTKLSKSIEKNIEKKQFNPKVLYKAYDEMYLGEPVNYPVDIVLNDKSEKIAEEADFRNKNPTSQAIPKSESYKLTLYGDSGAFKIVEAFSKENQSQKTLYNPDGLLHWSWIVTPLKEGNHILSLGISGKYREFLSPARPIYVRVKDPWWLIFLKQLPTFLNANWLWISGIAVGIWTLIKTLRTKKSNCDDSFE